MYSYSIALSIALSWFAGLSANLHAHEPGTVYWDAMHLAVLRAEAILPDTKQKAALSRLEKNADLALERGPYSVIYKEDVPPSGDKHDYMSFSRYWWPNPDTDDGLPYIRRDGEVNIKLRQRGDRDQIGMLCEDMQTLALAAYLLDEGKYAEHAAKLLRAWFLNPETRMNPHLRYGQSVPGLSEGRGVGIIDSRGFIWLLDSVELLKSIGAIDATDAMELEQWFAEYLEWLLTSDLGKDEAERENNHGAWYAAQVARTAIFVGKTDVAIKVVEQVLKERIPKQFAEDGSQPAELVRTQSLHYSFFNLEALFAVARAGDSLEINLWNPKSGTGLRPGIEFLVPFVLGEKIWQHPQMKKYSLSRGTQNLLRMASWKYDNSKLVEPILSTPVRHSEYDYSALLFREKRDASEESDDTYVTVEEHPALSPPVYELPDISEYTVEAIRQLVPTTLNGETEIGPSKGERVLEESFRRERGIDLQQRQGSESTRVIKITEGAVSLRELAAQLKDNDALTITDGVVTLRLPILVQSGATLVIDGNKTPEVRLSTEKGAFIANAGNLFIIDAKITSWEEKRNTATVFKSKAEFRPFVSSYIRSKTYLANSKFYHLGFHASTAYGLSLSSEPERDDPGKFTEWPTGQIIGNEFHGLYYGFYSYEARGVKIIDNLYSNCVLYAIDPHDRSSELIIARNTTTGTLERHGIIGSKGISNSFIFENVTHDNQGSGIMLDRECSGNIVCKNKVYNNGQGIAVYESSSNMIANNIVVQNAKSGIRIRNSIDIDVFDNAIVANGDYGLEASSKRLKDHLKRVTGGDNYSQVVSLRLFRNAALGNRGGVIKGNNVNRMVLGSLSLHSDLQDLESATDIQEIETYPSNEELFGSQLKKSASELHRVFDKHVEAVEYRQATKN